MKNILLTTNLTQVLLLHQFCCIIKIPREILQVFFFVLFFFLGFGFIFKDFWFLLSMYNSLGLHSSSLLAIYGHSMLYSLGGFFGYKILFFLIFFCRKIYLKQLDSTNSIFNNFHWTKVQYMVCHDTILILFLTKFYSKHCAVRGSSSDARNVATLMWLLLKRRQQQYQ